MFNLFKKKKQTTAEASSLQSEHVTEVVPASEQPLTEAEANEVITEEVKKFRDVWTPKQHTPKQIRARKKSKVGRATRKMNTRKGV